MTLIAEPSKHPRMQGQQADVAPGSPLALVALFTEIVRQRFRPENGLAWVWRENPTPHADESNDPQAPRKIQIEPAFNTQTETRNFRPAIFVDKMETSAPPAAINNFAGQQLRSGLQAFYAVATVPIEIEVISDRKGESATIADIVWFYLLAGRQEIAHTFGLHEISNPLLGRTVPHEVDRTAWSTRVAFTTQLHLRWTTLPISPLLREINTQYRASGETNPDAFLLKQYIR